MRFIDREHELRHLESEYRSGSPKFVVIYGRRRVGKTRLIEEFIKGKEALYYTAAQETEKQQVAEFKNIIASKLSDTFLQSADISTWTQMFAYLKKAWPSDKKIVLAIDEVTYIIKSNPSFPSYLQKLWDEHLSKTKTFLILSGSLIGLMLKEVLSGPSPLYGRRTSQMLLAPLGFSDASKFFKSFSFEERISYYSIIGGIPKYLELVNPGEPVEDFIKEKFLNKDGFFYQEALFLISQEFQEPSTYMDILKAISFGNTKLNEISNYTGMEAKIISRYLDILLAIGLIKKETPVTEDEKKSRKSIYTLKDNFLAFWYRFVQPNTSYIEIRRPSKAREQVSRDLNSFVGKAFEGVCKEAMTLIMRDATKMGKWWSKKGDEIDIVALDEKNREITFAECKWQDNANPNAILIGLKDKASLVEWNKGKRKESYVIFAKSFQNKKEENAGLYDLTRIEQLFKRMNNRPKK